jgi:hypothetical protein
MMFNTCNNALVAQNCNFQSIINSLTLLNHPSHEATIKCVSISLLLLATFVKFATSGSAIGVFYCTARGLGALSHFLLLANSF